MSMSHPELSASVFPTSVGVFLAFIERTERVLGLPHVRGGVSAAGGD